jgi:hypothetical protein
MDPFLTPIENIALDLIFAYMGEARENRTSDEYMRIASSLPPLKVLHYQVNTRLQEIQKSGTAPYQICRFRAGDTRIVYEEFPTAISIEVIRTALTKSGMRMCRRRTELKH